MTSIVVLALLTATASWSISLVVFGYHWVINSLYVLLLALILLDLSIRVTRKPVLNLTYFIQDLFLFIFRNLISSLIECMLNVGAITF